jgi:predicted acetyltransferase
VSIEIMAARERDYEVVLNLFQPYVHDLSEFMGWDVAESGRFESSDVMVQYWGREPSDPRFRWPANWRGFPFLVRVDGKLAGFVLVKEMGQDPPSYDLGEFFILRKFRGRGVAAEVARRVFDMFRGNWMVRALVPNKPAVSFWRRAIADYTGGDYRETVETFDPFPDAMVVQRFSNEAADSGGA